MNKKLLGFGALVLTIAAVGATASTALAYRGDPTVTGPNYTVERHTAMEAAMDAKDYTAWKNLMAGRGRVTQVVTADNFSKFVQAHELAEAGKTTEAAAIRAELGLGQGNGNSKGTGCGMGRGGR